MRSILFTNAKRGTLCLFAWNQNTFRLHLDAAYGTENADSAVEDAETALDFGGEVDVARCVDQGDPSIFPLDCYSSTVDSDALGFLDRIGVGGGVTPVHVAALVFGTSEIENAFRRRSLARVDVRDDAEITNIAQHDSPGPPHYAGLLQREKGSNTRSLFRLHG